MLSTSNKVMTMWLLLCLNTVNYINISKLYCVSILLFFSETVKISLLEETMKYVILK